MKEIFGIAALALSVGANIPYIFEIIKGKARPERISWLLWTLLGVTYYVSALSEGGATYFTFGELVGPITIFVLSLKYGVGGKSKFDTYSLFIAVLALVMLFFVDGVLISLLLALFVDAIGITLTIRKLRIDPTSESKSFWGLAALSSVCALLSLQNFTVETLLFPCYVLAISIYIFAKTDSGKVKNIQQLSKL